MAVLLSHSDKRPLWQSLREPSQLTHPNSQTGTIPPRLHRPSEKKNEEKKIPLIESKDVTANQLSITNKVWGELSFEFAAWGHFRPIGQTSSGLPTPPVMETAAGPGKENNEGKIEREWPESRISGRDPLQGNAVIIMSVCSRCAVSLD